MTGSEYTQRHLELVGRVIERLAPHRADVTAVEYNYESFGCWSIVFRRHGTVYRADFDGKDRLLLIYKDATLGYQFAHPSRLVKELPLATGLTDESLDWVVDTIVRATTQAGHK